MAEPRLALTVNYDVWRAVADAVRPEFADSYLSGAAQIGNRITTHTIVAFERLQASKQAAAALDQMAITLIKPLPFGHADRVDYAL